MSVKLKVILFALLKFQYDIVVEPPSETRNYFLCRAVVPSQGNYVVLSHYSEKY